MLTTLRIKNLALVTDLTLDLEAGYTVITGETGAGKSILIGALDLILGQRADRTLIRSGSDSCSVEAVFQIGKLKAPVRRLLEENGIEPCEDDQLVLKRTFTSAGANRQFVNGSPTTLNVLAALGQWLVDIHGPHEHQSLLHPASQLAILDAYGKLEAERQAFAELLERRACLAQAKAALIIDERSYAQQLDLLRFQVQEISSAHLQPGEAPQLEQDYQRASNAAKLLQLSQAALEVLSENDSSLQTQAGSIGRTLQELRRIDTSSEHLISLHDQATAVLQELQVALSRYAGRLELDPARLQQLEERLNLLQTLKRKYGGTIEEVLVFGEQARSRLDALEQRDAELLRLNTELERVDAELWRAGQTLSAKRQKAIPSLSKAVSQQLGDLGFMQSRFNVSIESLAQPSAQTRRPEAPVAAEDRTPFTSSGLDTIEFQFAPNPGEPARPLLAIASSGETARVMLALKTVLAAQDRIPVLVFDEVDANIGGETAHTVGQKMQELARSRQVLCITHLPQVAAPADTHLLVAKQTRVGRTVSEIRPLTGDERVTELARMLGGQTEAARKHAEALLQ
jgi:DNA repair protein RecN (Recombination protein N)